VHARLRDLILRHASEAPESLSGAIAQTIGADTLEKLHALRHVAISPCMRKPGDIELARMTLAEELAKLETRRGLSAEIEEAVEDLPGAADEALTWRLSQAAQAMGRASRSENEDKAEYDTGKNGARINRDERNALDALLGNITYSKPGR
jgi:DNA primase